MNLANILDPKVTAAHCFGHGPGSPTWEGVEGVEDPDQTRYPNTVILGVRRTFLLI